MDNVLLPNYCHFNNYCFCNRERRLATTNKQVTDAEFSKQNVYGTKIVPKPYKYNVKQNHFQMLFETSVWLNGLTNLLDMKLYNIMSIAK